jgi:hypothetical protein
MKTFADPWTTLQQRHPYSCPVLTAVAMGSKSRREGHSQNKLSRSHQETG